MKKTVLFLLILLMVTVSAAHAEIDIDTQIDLIARYADAWKEDVDFGLWCYTVTDLDQNGRLEIIAASVQGTGNYTYINIMEVSEDGTALLPVRQNRGEGDSAPDIIVDSVPEFIYEPDDHYYYIFDDYIRNGYAESYFTKNAVWLEDGVWNEYCMASGSLIYQDEEHYTETYRDAEGLEITKEQYDRISDRYFNGCREEKAQLVWNSVDNEQFAAMTAEELRTSLMRSWNK